MNEFHKPSSMHELILHSEKLHATREFIYTWKDGDFSPVSYAQFTSDVRRSALWLIEHGYQGKKIMLLGKNSYEWMVCYVAIVAYVGTCVGAGKDWKHYDLVRGSQVVEPAALIADESLLSHASSLPSTIAIFSFNEVVASGSALMDNDQRFDTLARKKDDMAIVVFTTGTTSFPKAVPLSFTNMFANAQELYERSLPSSDDVFYMFLPMHHIYSQVCVSVAALLVGAKLYLAHDTDNLKQELQLSRPTLISGVPLFFERVIGAIEASDMHKIRSALKVLNAVHAPAALRRRVFKKVHEVFGGRLRLFTSGGAPLGHGTKQLLLDMGFMLFEGYGMSEASGVVSAGIAGREMPGSVGVVLDGVEVRIAHPEADGFGEVLVRGANVMKGYLRGSEIITDCFDEDGFYKTSDRGFVDKNRNLFITGRMGKSLVLSNGENVSIDEIVTLINAVMPVDKVYLSQQNGYLEAEIFTRQSQKEADEALKRMNAGLPKYKQIVTWTIINEYVKSEMK